MTQEKTTYMFTCMGFQHFPIPALIILWSHNALAGRHSTKNSMTVMMAEMMTLMEIDLSIHFRQLPGGAILSIRNAIEALPIAMLKMHSDRDMTLSSKASDSWSGFR